MSNRPRSTYSDVVVAVATIATAVLGFWIYFKSTSETSVQSGSLSEAQLDTINDLVSHHIEGYLAITYVIFVCLALLLIFMLWSNRRSAKLEIERRKELEQIRKKAGEKIRSEVVLALSELSNTNNTQDQLWLKTYFARFENIKQKIETVPFIKEKGILLRQWNVPTLKDKGRYTFEDGDLDYVSEEKNNLITLDDGEKVNEPVGIRVEALDWSDGPVNTIGFSNCYYAELLSLRHKKRVWALSGNAVVFCSENNCLIAHKRNKDASNFYKGDLHTFGGHLTPEVGGSQRFQDESFYDCIERELKEESGITALAGRNLPFLLIDENEIDFVQLTVLGLNISRETASIIHLSSRYQHYEGTPVEIPFDTLEKKLAKYDKWVPSGWCQIMVWLATGAPGSDENMTFGTKSAEEVFDAVIASVM
jgi:hypothetical protein